MTFPKDKKTRFYKQRRISSLIKSGFACLTVTTQFLYPDGFTIANNNNKVNQKNLFFVYIFYILFIFVLHRGIVSYKNRECSSSFASAFFIRVFPKTKKHQM